MAYVQHILGHKYQSTLQKYINPSTDEVIEAGLAHHARQEHKRAHPSPPPSHPPTTPSPSASCSEGPSHDDVESHPLDRCPGPTEPGAGWS